MSGASSLAWRTCARHNRSVASTRKRFPAHLQSPSRRRGTPVTLRHVTSDIMYHHVGSHATKHPKLESNYRYQIQMLWHHKIHKCWIKKLTPKPSVWYQSNQSGKCNTRQARRPPENREPLGPAKFCMAVPVRNGMEDGGPPP